MGVEGGGGFVGTTQASQGLAEIVEGGGMIGLELGDFLEQSGGVFEVAEIEMGSSQEITDGVDGAVEVFGDLKFLNRLLRLAFPEKRGSQDEVGGAKVLIQAKKFAGLFGGCGGVVGFEKGIGEILAGVGVGGLESDGLTEDLDGFGGLVGVVEAAALNREALELVAILFRCRGRRRARFGVATGEPRQGDEEGGKSRGAACDARGGSPAYLRSDPWRHGVRVGNVRSGAKRTDEERNEGRAAGEPEGAENESQKGMASRGASRYPGATNEVHDRIRVRRDDARRVQDHGGIELGESAPERDFRELAT